VTTRKGKGFTLIELLVVIAIIAILAAMLFPVFARARESARKIQCLSNIKNIAMAIQMYMTDYEKGPPWEHRQEVRAFFDGNPGGGTVWDPGDCGPMTDHANPYMRYPVVLDEYVRNRQVWNCPSSKLQGGAMFIYSNPDWFRELVDSVGQWGNGQLVCPKDGCFPNGWGGAITDSVIQQQSANTYWGGSGSREAVAAAFTQSVAVNFAWSETKPGSVRDPAGFIVCHDAGSCVDYTAPGHLAYPELCAAECSDEECAWAQWQTPGCVDTCGDFIYSLPPDDGSYAKDPELMKPFTRHLGGSNIGWLDGHASWMPARAVVNGCIEQGEKGIAQPYGMWPWAGGYPQWCGGWDPGRPTFYQPG